VLDFVAYVDSVVLDALDECALFGPVDFRTQPRIGSHCVLGLSLWPNIQSPAH